MSKKERTGNRKKRGEAFKRIPDLGNYIIVTDTEATEKNYLEGLRDSLPLNLQGRIVIKVLKSKTSELVNNCKIQAAMEPQYCEPWIVFDRDRVTNFDEIIQNATAEGIKSGWSNPCIEIWFDAYFGQMHSYIESKQCCSRFAETYEKETNLKYDKADKNIYKILNRFGNELNAISIAESRLKTHMDGGTVKPSAMIPATTLHHLINEIRKKANNC